MSVLFRLVQAVQAKQRPSQGELARDKTWGKFQCPSNDRLSLSKFPLIAKNQTQAEMRLGVMTVTRVDGSLKRLLSLFLTP
jgi:hypothetical protein